jgi:selenocysteine lyase/cysteine desulfurase
VFGSSTTQLFRNLSYTLKFEQGDELVISGVDHEANIAAWVDLADRQGLVIKWWQLPSSETNPRLTVANLQPLLSERTRLVTCTHASNILGTIHDIKAIAKAVHGTPRGMLCVDGVAYAPHRPVDMRALGVDFYAFSWYKVYGPHISILYADAKAQEQMQSLGHFFNPHKTLESKIGLAGASYELVQAIPAVLDYLGPAGSAVWETIRQQEYALQSILLEYLNGREDVTIYGEKSADTSLRVSTISFRVNGWGARELVETVEKDSNLAFRWGGFYSYRLVVQTLGLGDDGVVRVSMVHYNTGQLHPVLALESRAVLSIIYPFILAR